MAHIQIYVTYLLSVSISSNHLRLESIAMDGPIDAFIVVEKTKKVRGKAGIKIDVEKAIP